MFQKYFTIVKKITKDIILEIPFLTQIYPFYVDKNGVHAKVLEETITFAFLSSTNQQVISLLQKSSISKQIINTIFMKDFTNSNPCFTFQECWQEKSDHTHLFAGTAMNKKHKGKGIQNANDSQLVRHSGTFHDIQVPVQNKFSSLSNYPPLPYIAVVT